MKKKTYIIISLWVIIAICWILIFTLNYTEKMVFVHTPDLESKPGIQILDANNPYFKVTNEPNRIYAEWNETKMILKESKCRMKKPIWKYIYVYAELNNNQYPLVIDTGFRGSFLVNDLVVTENNLEIYPITNRDPSFEGFCHIDKIRIGDMTIENPESYYRPSHYERKILGITTFQQKKIILGLGIMRLFRYVMIDNIDSVLEFSMDSYNPESLEAWSQYNMHIDNSRRTPNLMVDIPIAGENTEITFDTGYDCCLIMTEKIWEQYSTKVHKVKEKKSSVMLLSGLCDIRDVTIDRLRIGDKTLSNESIHIFSDDTRYGPDFFAIGIDCFRDTVVVLDFEHNLFWVKQTTDLISNN